MVSRLVWTDRSGSGVLVLLNHFLAVLVNEIDKDFDVIRIHVRIDSMAKIGNVISMAEFEKHVLCQLGKLFLYLPINIKEKRTWIRINRIGFSDFVKISSARYLVGIESTWVEVSLKSNRFTTDASGLIWLNGPI